MLRHSTIVLHGKAGRELQTILWNRSGWFVRNRADRVLCGATSSRLLSHLNGNFYQLSTDDNDTIDRTGQLTKNRYSDLKISKLPFATCDPEILSPHNAKVANLIGGHWAFDVSNSQIVPDPLNGKPMIAIADVQQNQIGVFVEGLKRCPKYGLHNPLSNTHRYLLYGQICAQAASLLSQPDVMSFFARLIQRVSPKSHKQAMGEVLVTRNFLQNFCGDQVRFLARSFGSPGDHQGQSTQGYRWPYGPVAIITPFNFPLEIPALQVLGALFMGNKPLLKVDHKVSIVMEQFLRLLIHCGMPPTDVDFVNCSGSVMHSILLEAQPRNTVFTGSSRVADILAKDLAGRIKVEGAGFDWKVLGPIDPSVSSSTMDFVAYVCDQDAYACSGQKCSAQSMLLVHESWNPRLIPKLKALAESRNLENLTVGPFLSVTTETFRQHLADVLKIPGSELLWGGKELNNGDHSIPQCYGAMEPTAVFVPIESILSSEENFRLATTEIFAPFQVITYFRQDQLPLIYEVVEKMDEHLTAAIVSNDIVFQQELLSRSVNGTTYVGIRARTSGAPQNHWFGPAGDPRAAGIGTAEAIQGNWSCHREIIRDFWPVPDGWTTPFQS